MSDAVGKDSRSSERTTTEHTLEGLRELLASKYGMGLFIRGYAEWAADEIERLRAAMEESWRTADEHKAASILFNALWPGHTPECARYYDGRFLCHPDCEVAS